MKVGILTYHRTFNYGGCLQALATRLLLEELGHSVFYIDYWPSYHKHNYSLISYRSIWQSPTLASGIRSFLVSLKNFPYTLKRHNHFEQFLRDNILPYCKGLDEVYDVVLYGSDQIWRKQPIIDSYNPVYFAQNTFRANK